MTKVAQHFKKHLDDFFANNETFALINALNSENSLNKAVSSKAGR